MEDIKQVNEVSEEQGSLSDIAVILPKSGAANEPEFQTASEPTILEEASKERSKLRLAAILLALNCSTFVAALDQTIIATAVPTIVSDLGNASGYVWVGGSYLLANAASAPLWAKFSDIWGRKPLLLLAAALFFGSSIIAAESKNMTTLIVGRTLQGTAAGGLIQLVFIVISDIFNMRERSLFMGLTSFTWAIAGAVGPIMGGAFTQTIGWKWCFWINLPISGSAFLLILGFLDVHNPRTRLMDGIKAVDWFGSLTILGMTLMFLLGLEFGGATFPWDSPQVICLLVIGPLMGIFFIYSEKRLTNYPVMPLELFQESSNVACIVLGFLHGFIFIAVEYFAPLYFQAVMGASPLQSGFLLLPVVVAQSLMAFFAGIFIHLTGKYLEPIRIGPVIMTVGVGLYVLFSPSSTTGMIVGFQILTGLGCGLLFEPPLLALQVFVPQQNVATASSTYNFVRTLGSAMSIAIGGVILQNSMDIRVKTLAAPPFNLPSNITDLLANEQAAANVLTVNSIQNPLQKMAVREAFAWSLRNLWIFYVVISALCVVATVFIKKRVLTREHVETKTGVRINPESPPLP